MNFGEWINQWKLDSLKVNVKFLEMEFKVSQADKQAAWELYVELLTRITTQYLPVCDGDEESALKSVYQLFDITREIIKKYQFECIGFSKIAIIILNQKIRPFTSKWHKESINGSFSDQKKCIVFRAELRMLQEMLNKYAKMLADIAGVEDLTELEPVD